MKPQHTIQLRAVFATAPNSTHLYSTVHEVIVVTAAVPVNVPSTTHVGPLTTVETNNRLYLQDGLIKRELCMVTLTYLIDPLQALLRCLCIHQTTSTVR
jgi:hypothetical protein